jgi:uncharacterized protein with HEPN domain
MPSKDPKLPLQDIRDNIRFALSCVEGYTLDQFLNDQKTVYAVTRALEIISEASRRLPESIKQNHPHIPWPEIAGAGNIYRHDYEDVSATMVWNTLKTNLPVLKHTVDQELSARSV